MDYCQWCLKGLDMTKYMHIRGNCQRKAKMEKQPLQLERALESWLSSWRQALALW